jgi:hypothetical protein
MPWQRGMPHWRVVACGLERVYYGLNKVTTPLAFLKHSRLRIGITHRGARHDGEQPHRPQHAQRAKQTNVVAPMLDPHRCEYKRDPKGYYQQGVSVCPNYGGDKEGHGGGE